MVVAFRALASSIPTSTATSVTVTAPAGIVTGDLLLFFAGNSQPNTWGTVPTGWTLVTKPGTNSSDLASACWYKIATGSDIGGTSTYTATSGGTACPVIGVIVAYSGENSTSFPLASTKFALAHGTTASTTSTVPTNPSSINATDLVCRAYIAGFGTSGTSRTMGAAPSGWTQRGSGLVTNVTSNFQVGMVVCDKLAGSDTLTTTSSVASMWDVYGLAIPVAPASSSIGNFLPFFL